MSNGASLAEGRPHLLNDKWTWSYKPTIVYKPQTADDWMSDYRQVIPRTFNTAEEFWGIFQHLPPLPKLDLGNIYAVFKEGVQPTWEHPRNEHGYSIVFYPNKSNSEDYIQELYQASLLLLLSAAGPFSSNINGCTFERKTAGTKIVFWMAQCPPTPTSQLNTVKQILHAIKVPKSDTTLTDNAARIDWKDQKFSSFKIAIRCVSHKKRANEPPPQRSNQPHKRGGRRGGGNRPWRGGGGGPGDKYRKSSRSSTNRGHRQPPSGRGESGRRPQSKESRHDKHHRRNRQ